MFNKIFVAIDGSEPRIHALEVAAKLALENDAELTIFTVAPYPPPFIIEEDMQVYLPKYHDDLRESYKRLLNKTNNELNAKHPQLKTVPIVMEGKPAKLITDVAKERQAELIVIGNKGSSGIIDWMLGSVSQKVANSCTAPVLIVKDEKYCQV
jgi:nucleotide-binding universal stress UspA family protein